MTQPVLNQAPNYDADNEYTFTFTYLGAELTTKNELSIREDKTNSQPVYDKVQTSLDKNHILPSKTLKNGVAYLAKIRVILDSGFSEWSPEIKFTCYTTPKIIFDTIDQKEFVYTNDVLMSALYMQAENEPAKNYQFILYDQRHVTLQSYPVRVPNPDSPTRFSERVSDLEKGKLYYIGLRVITTHGIHFEQQQQFTAQYVAPSVSGVLQPLLNAKEGQISVELFLKQLLGTSAKAYVPYSKDDSDDNFTYWKDDYVVIPKDNPLMFTKLAMAKASDWVAKIWCMNVQNGIMFDFSPQYGEGQHIKFVKHDDYITCEKRFGQIQYRTRSNVVDGLGLRPFYLYIKVTEFRVEMHIEPDKTFIGDDLDSNKSKDELDNQSEMTKPTQDIINQIRQLQAQIQKRIDDDNDIAFNTFKSQVDFAIMEVMNRNIDHQKLIERTMESEEQLFDTLQATNHMNDEERKELEKYSKYMLSI